jgi:hypothetical protein
MPAEGSTEPADSVAGSLDLLAYLVTSADLCTREPLHYGMFRLIDAAGRLAALLEASGEAIRRPWISELQESIQQNKESIMWDREEFERFLHDCAALLAGAFVNDAGVRNA